MDKINSIQCLIIEDDEDDFFLTEDALNDITIRPHAAVWAPSFEEAMEFLATQSFDVCLVDYRIGAKTGLDFIRESIAKGYRVPMILITGVAAREIEEDASRAGAFDFIEKSEIDGRVLERSIRFSIEKARQMQKLAESTALLRATLEHTGAGIGALSVDGVLETCNNRFIEFLGIDSRIRSTATEDGEAYAINRELSDDVTRKLNEFEFDASSQTEFVTDDLRTIEIRRNVAPDGRTVVLCSDVTQRKQTELELIQSREAAIAASTAKSEFLATMSHEIRTPMNGVLGLASLVLDTNLTSEQREYIDTIRSSGEALLTIINDILDFSKMEAGKLELEIVDFDLLEVVESVAPLLAAKIVEKSLELGTFVSPEAPWQVAGDPGRLRQVLLNLVGNAIKFTERGSVVVEVAVAADEDDAVLLRFEVRDTGIGISKDIADSLFSRFTQADNSVTRKYGGTGLGLSICKEIVELMGGDIGVESEPGRGSIFWFSARLGKADSTEPNPSRYPTELVGRRVLVVDDNDLNRKIFRKQLESFGMRASEAADGPSALAAMKDAVCDGAPFEVALIDFMMPEMDGFELARRIRDVAELTTTKLVLASSASEPYSASRDDKTVWDVELVKPVLQSRLSNCLGKLFGAASDPYSDAMASENEPKTEQSRSSRRLRILLVEDNQVNQQVARLMLIQAGHSVDIASNGAEAVVAIRDLPYDLVLMDIHMPEMDGITACKRIRNLPEEKGQVPIIALTANAMAGDRKKYLAAGMNDYVTKPIARNKLISAISRQCGTKERNDDKPQEVAAVLPLNSIDSTQSQQELGDLLQSLDELMEA